MRQFGVHIPRWIIKAQYTPPTPAVAVCIGFKNFLQNKTYSRAHLWPAKLCLSCCSYTAVFVNKSLSVFLKPWNVLFFLKSKSIKVRLEAEWVPPGLRVETKREVRRLEWKGRGEAGRKGRKDEAPIAKCCWCRNCCENFNIFHIAKTPLGLKCFIGQQVLYLRHANNMNTVKSAS